MPNARGVESILTDRRVLDWGNKIMKLDPEKYPLLVLSQALGTEPAVNQVYIDFEDKPFERWMFIGTVGSLDGATEDTTFYSLAAGGVDWGHYINVGDLLYDYTVEDYLYIVSVTRGTPDIFAVVKNYSDQGTANMALATQSGKTFDTNDTVDSAIPGHADDDIILKVSNTFEDGGVSADPIALNLEKNFNFCQKFKWSYQVDEEIMQATLNGEPELQRLQFRAGIEFLKNIEYQFILGKKDARTYEGTTSGQTNKYIYTTGGLYHSGMDSDDIAVPLTETALRSYFRSGFMHGPSEKIFIAGGLIVEGLDVWSMGRLQTKEDTTKTGLHIKQYLMAGGTVDIVAHPLLEGNLEGMAFLLDMSVLKYKVFKSIKLHTGIQANDVDERKDQYKGIVGLKIGLLDNHRRIKGVESIAG